jgi:hypothetical protein
MGGDEEGDNESNEGDDDDEGYDDEDDEGDDGDDEGDDDEGDDGDNEGDDDHYGKPPLPLQAHPPPTSPRETYATRQLTCVLPSRG